MKWYTFIQKFFGLIFALGMALGFFFPDVFMPVAGWTMLLLGIVITLTFITIDLNVVAANLKRFHNIGIVFLVLKVLLPFLLYRLALPLGPAISVAVLLLSLTPFAGVSPTLTRIVGGDTEFVLIMQVFLTLIAPFYIPFLLKLFAGKTVVFDTLLMMKNLLLVIVIPFILSLILKPLFKKTIEKTRHTYGAVSILSITLLLTGLLATAADDIKSNPAIALPMTGYAFVLGIILMFAGWYLFFFLDKKKRLGLTVGNIYMNIGLIAVIAAEFFNSEVMMFILIYELPANLMPSLVGRIPLFRLKEE